MPKDGFFFDSIIRQKPIDHDHIDPEDNTEQYTPRRRPIWMRSKRTRKQSAPENAPS